MRWWEDSRDGYSDRVEAFLGVREVVRFRVTVASVSVSSRFTSIMALVLNKALWRWYGGRDIRDIVNSHLRSCCLR